jgi:hypothetical protein
MPSSGILCRVALIRTDVSEERIASIIKSDKNRRARKKVSSNYQPKHTAKEYYSNVLRLVVIAKFVPSSPIVVTLMMEALFRVTVVKTSTVTSPILFGT